MKFNFFLIAIILAIKPISSQCVGNVNIPDANFKTALLEQSLINTDGDLEISCAEATAYLGLIFVRNKSIKDLTGIEAFINIKALDCEGNLLTNLDVSKNTNLYYLNCRNNSLTSLDLSMNVALNELICTNNSLTSLDLSNNKNLDLVWANENSLTSLNVANGNNHKISSFSANRNPSLFCIQIDAGFTPPDRISGTPGWERGTYSSSCTPVLKWSGARDNNWHTAVNWEEGVVPVSTDRVEIPTGLTKYPTISNEVTVESITIQNKATLIAKSKVNATIICNKRILENWDLITPPVANQTYAKLVVQHNYFEQNSTNKTRAIGVYNNDMGSAWNYEVINSSPVNSLVGKSGLGLSVKATRLTDITFSGNINAENVSYPITVGDRTNFNLLGNPFTSYINSENFVNTNSSLLNEKTIWLWNGKEYETYTLANPIKIEPARGFFVTAISDGDVVFETENQSHKIANALARKNNSTNIKLLVNDKSTKIYFIENTTVGFDNGYDGSMFEGTNNDFAVYTKLVGDKDTVSNKKLAIQVLPISNLETMVIPVGLIAEAGKQIELSINSENLPTGIEIYLEDRINNTFTNLSQENFTTTLQKASNGAGQFYIHTSSKSLSTDEIVKSKANISVYKSSNKEITITGLQGKADVQIYSTLGEELMSKKVDSNGNSKVSIANLSSGVYIVRLQSSLGNISKKIILK